MSRPMLTLATALFLTQGALGPAHVTLLGTAPTRAERAALLTSTAALPGTGILLVEDAPPTPPPGQPGASVQDLRLERERLADSRPSLGAGIGMLASGVVLSLAGAVLAVYGGAYLAVGALFGQMFATSSAFLAVGVVGIVILAVGVVVLAVGIPLLIVGAVKLSRTVRERSAIGQEMDKIDERIRALEQATPPPPPAPMSVERARTAAPLVTVASF